MPGGLGDVGPGLRTTGGRRRVRRLNGWQFNRQWLDDHRLDSQWLNDRRLCEGRDFLQQRGEFLEDLRVVGFERVFRLRLLWFGDLWLGDFKLERFRLRGFKRRGFKLRGLRLRGFSKGRFPVLQRFRFPAFRLFNGRRRLEVLFPAVRRFNGRYRLEVLLRRHRRGYIGGRCRLRSRRCEFESRCLLGVDGTIHRPMLRRQFRLHVVKVTNCRLNSSHREGARIVDDPGFFCLSGGIDQSRATNVLEFFVRRIDYPLQVRLQVFDKRSGLGGNCGQLSRPQPAGHPRSAVHRRPEGRDHQRFLGSSPEALTRRISPEDCHRPSLPSSPVPLLRCCWLKTAGELCE